MNWDDELGKIQNFLSISEEEAEILMCFKKYHARIQVSKCNSIY